VVQIAPVGGVNVFNCSPGTGSGSCFVLQISAGAPAATAGDPPPVTNKYNCTESTSANPAVLDSATCGPLVQSNTNGNNQATIAQAIQQQSAGGTSQSAMETAGSQSTPLSQTNVSGNNLITIQQHSIQNSSDTPTAAQTIYVSQVNTSGQNTATVGQLEQQHVSDAALTQDQEATQIACLTQDSQSGQNVATMTQHMNQNETDSASGISQFQNQFPGPLSTSCGGSSTTIRPNVAAFVLQNQNPLFAGATGQHQLTDQQSLQQQQTSTASSLAVTQQQGPNFDVGGLEAVPAQTSTGLSTANTSQNEQQNMQASTTGPLSQTQNDPIHQPTGEGFQTSNPNDTFTLTQTGVQQAGPAALQNFDIRGDCFTSGTCNVTSTDTSNGVTTSRSCGPASCTTFVTPPD
jgi:hypothetical protein